MKAALKEKLDQIGPLGSYMARYLYAVAVSDPDVGDDYDKLMGAAKDIDLAMESGVFTEKDKEEIRQAAEDAQNKLNAKCPFCIREYDNE